MDELKNSKHEVETAVAAFNRRLDIKLALRRTTKTLDRLQTSFSKFKGSK